jgi:hypothetical protein
MIMSAFDAALVVTEAIEGTQLPAFLAPDNQTKIPAVLQVDALGNDAIGSLPSAYSPDTGGSGSLGALGTISDSLKGTIKVAPQPASAFSVGQANIATTGTAVQLPNHSLTNGIVITADLTNSSPIYVGSSGVTNSGGGSGNGYQLAAGQSVALAISNSDILWVNGVAGSAFYFIGN